jgi:hypothetical protein
MKEYFEKVEIHSEDDLPKEDGLYICASGKVIAEEYFCIDNPYDIAEWVEDIDWYFRPVTLPDKPTDEEIESFAKSRPGNTGNFMIDAGVTSGFIVGAKWARDFKRNPANVCTTKDLEDIDKAHQCSICHKNWVDSDNGYDTCQSCLNNI